MNKESQNVLAHTMFTYNLWAVLFKRVIQVQELTLSGKPFITWKQHTSVLEKSKYYALTISSGSWNTLLI